MDVQRKLTKARTQLILDHPFFGSLALKMPMIPEPANGTLCTDGTAIYYDPAYIEQLSLDECKGVIAHEVMHPAQMHHIRQDQRENADWNLACDYAINPYLTESGLILPKGAAIDQRYIGKSAEEVYGQIHQKPTPQNAPGQGQGQGQGNGPGQGQGNGQGQQTQPNNAPGQNPNDPGKCGQVRKAPHGQEQQQKNAWRVNLAQAAQAAKAQGKLPASLARLVEDLLNPKADWRELLRAFVERSARNDYNWSTPNRRHMQRGFYLPTLISEELRPITVAVDTSGSIDQKTLDQFAAELSDMLSAYRTTATVIYCDAAVQRTEQYTPEDLPLRLKPHGGGGTDFRPVFDWQAKQGDDPACLIYLTDLYGTFPEQAPDYPVLWGALGNGQQTPPWGDLVQID